MRTRLVLVVLVTVLAGGTLASCTGHTSQRAALPSAAPPSAALRTVPKTVTNAASNSATTTTATTTTTTMMTTPPPPREPAMTALATLHGPTPASAMPGAPPVSQVPASWYGYTSVLPVISIVAGWVEVREAQRPNESTAWVPEADVTLSTDPYYMVLSLTTEHLQLFVHGDPVLDMPAGIGTPSDPTVTGQFFITMKYPPPSPAYGPFLLVTSAHSDTITDWEQTGDAIIAIHGPIDAAADQAIGTTGARISHGCIRLHDADLAQLAGVPAGTPLDIVA